MAGLEQGDAMATTTRTPGSNIEIIWADWIDALRRGDIASLAARLAPEVTHRGVRADLLCPDRDAVLANARSRSQNMPEVDAIELVAAGDRVVLSIRSPGVGMPLSAEADQDERRGMAAIVFTLRDGLITEMQDYPTRTAALEAAGASADIWG
jgi:ketosteroid isomerase-like protein